MTSMPDNITPCRTPESKVREISYAEAIREALAQAMEADPTVFTLGEDIGVYGGAFGVTGDLVHRFGEERVRDTPISELGIAGAAVGAALTGMKPVLELQFSDFITLATEQIVNQAAKIRYMYGGHRADGRPHAGRPRARARRPSTARVSRRGSRTYRDSRSSSRSTPYDAKGLLLAAIDDPNPVLIFEHKLLYRTKGPVPQEPYRVPIGKAEIRRQGRDVTIAATSMMAIRAMSAADWLTRVSRPRSSTSGRSVRWTRRR